MNNILIFKQKKQSTKPKLNKTQAKLAYLEQNVIELSQSYKQEYNLLSFKIKLNATTKGLLSIQERFLTEKELNILESISHQQQSIINYSKKMIRLSKFKLIKSA